jgi:predicted peptidase
VADEMNADPNRITITGLSMGGFGTWEMICAYPDLFAAAGPICGGGVPWRLLGLTHFPPIRTFHGDADDAVPIQFSYNMVNGVSALGGDVEFTVYPGVPHNCWTRTYEETDLIEWLANAKK